MFNGLDKDVKVMLLAIVDEDGTVSFQSVAKDIAPPPKY